jgi:hypothetical protein
MRATRIMVKCPDCGEARVGLGDVTLRYCVDTEEWSYRFACMPCGLPAVAPTSSLAALEAEAAGCAVEEWRLPAELLEPHDGPMLTTADLVDLHQLLLEPGWFEALVHSSDGTQTS